MHSLPLFVRLKDRPVILLGTSEAADAKRRLLDRAGARIVGEDAPAALAIVAIEADGEAEAAIARLKARGVLVNAVDRPALCDFTLPAIVDRDPVLIAVGTGGASAGLAKAVRQRIEALLPATLGTLAQALEDARPAMKARWPLAAQRRRALDAALAEGGPLDPLRTQDADAVSRWLDRDGAQATDHLIAITLISGDPDDLTLRTARLMGEADRIYHTADVPAAILIRARADAQRITTDHVPEEAGPGLSLWLEMASR
ncbi:precorrin-2 dehydrogenase/sirohydrochlorin ferrochelatase family protein [Sphingobium algorifonticola]|uniref:precorrin-2 dehydrogenase n=1 Tax=Sphingobium algorifonticola TaxID=2008318 RepID=A0A437JDV9_9SPHN|nr:bifunctional precorrin-2 dehydrogenase/sirohydrochlorin ferrochelatase [Sphingobium algorifonticola]RVT43933.1 siroheme synthase [Sphingobium algorifonticola]